MMPGAGFFFWEEAEPEKEGGSVCRINEKVKMLVKIKFCKTTRALPAIPASYVSGFQNCDPTSPKTKIDF